LAAHTDIAHTVGAYNFNGLGRVSWGVPAATAVADAVARRGAQRVLIVASPSLAAASPVPDQTRTRLGEHCVGLFSAVQPHTPAPTVDALVALMRETEADLVVSFGGGSPIDTVKAALAVLASGAPSALEASGKAANWILPPVRQIAVPTTLSGAEFSDLAGLTDPVTRIKGGVAGPGIGPVEVILDAALTLQTPRHLWLSTGIRAVDHAVETVCSIAPTPFTDALALAQLAASLRTTARAPDDLSARLASQQAVWLASSGLDRTPFGASHGIGHQLGAVAAVPHGVCSCVLLPAVLDWNFESTRHCAGGSPVCLGRAPPAKAFAPCSRIWACPGA
jgi:alcohol dehydrogenase class IV